MARIRREGPPRAAGEGIARWYRRLKRVWCGYVLTGGILLVGAAGADAQPKVADKVLIATFEFVADSTIGPRAYKEPLVGYGPGVTTSAPSKREPEESEVVFVLLDAKNNPIREYRIWHPRWMVTHDPSVKDGIVRVPRARFAAKFPFDERAATIAAIEYKRPRGTIDLTDTIRVFCGKNTDDKECAKWFTTH